MRFTATTLSVILLMAPQAFGQAPADAGRQGQASDPAPASQEAQAGDRAKRAEEEAYAGAFAMLFRRVAELRITPDVRVADLFLADGDERAAAWHEMCLATQVGPAQRYSDGAVAVQVRLNVGDVVAGLAKACRSTGRTPAFRAADFEKIRLYYDRDALWGFGQSRGEAIPAIGDTAPVGWRGLGAFARLDARRRATAQAYRQLGERILALRLTAARRVADFVAADARIARDLELFVRSQPACGTVRYTPQRLCEVDCTLEIASLSRELKSLANAYYTGTEFKQETFDGLSLLAGSPKISVTGRAVPEADLVGSRAGTAVEAVPDSETGPPLVERPAGAPAGPLEEVASCSAQADLPPQIEDRLQARLLAVRSALAQCREQLRKRCLGESAPDGRTAAELLTSVPELRRDIDTLLGNVREVRVKEVGPDRVEVFSELPLERLRELLRHYGPASESGTHGE